MKPGVSLSLLAAVVLVGLALASCSKPPPVSSQALDAPAPPAGDVAPPPTEFVVLIDNSKSIKPPEQIIIREATMLLADLADPGDRIGVITFGEGARVVVERELRTDADRDAFKAAVRDQVDFSENFSDIRAGVRVLAEQRSQLLPSAGAVRAVVLFTDGKLESADRQTRAAFEQLRSDLRGPLVDLPVYAVVLGDSYSGQPIPGLTELTGLELMREHVATSSGHYYHAVDIEELPDIAVTILNDTKGIASLGEEGGVAFRVDSTVELMNLIVRKRAPDATANDPLPLSSEIALMPPQSSETVVAGSPDGPQSGAVAPPRDESIYRSTDYQHFDLFVVRNPRSGVWRVQRSDGEPPRVLSKIVSPVALRVSVPPTLYVDAGSRLQAWLYDQQRGAPVHAGYTLQARVAEAGALASSERFVPLRLDDETGRFGLDLPTALFAALGQPPAPGDYEIEVIARKDDDTWFTRRSQPIRLRIDAPLVLWRQVPELLQPIPFLASPVTFGASVEKGAYQSLGLEAPAELTLSVDRFDPQTDAYVRVAEETMTGSDAEDAIQYALSLDLRERGDYRYSYLFTGSRAGEAVRIQSLPAGFRIDLPWIPLGIAVGVLLIGLELLLSLTAKLRGRVDLEQTGPRPAFETLSVSPRRELRSSAFQEVDLGAARFRVRPRRHLLLPKRLCVSATGVDATLNGMPLKRGATRCVPPRGRHLLRFDHPDSGDPVEVALSLRI